MPMPEDRLETVEHTLNKAYGEIMRELSLSKTYTENAVDLIVGQKITLNGHAQLLNDHTARLDRIETMLTRILAHLSETPSASPVEHKSPEPVQPEPVRLKRDRTFWERAMGIFPEETEPEKP
jgi:hypothetical protein